MSADNPVRTDPPAVALLFEDTEQSAHLRDALVAFGARIVFEGPATDIGRDALANSGADVVVVNLDATVEKHLDRVHDALDVSRQRVVYNDADASRHLSGWDQARWARHLAAKLMDQFDTDPPRPHDARPVHVGESPSATGDEVVTTDPLDARSEISAAQVETASAESEALASELGALMAEGNDLQAQLHAQDATDFMQASAEDAAADFDPEETGAEPGSDAPGAVMPAESMDDDDVAPASGNSVPEAADQSHDAAADALTLVDLDDDVDASGSAADSNHAADVAQHAPDAPASPDWETVTPDAGVEGTAAADRAPMPQAPEWELLNPDAESGDAHAQDHADAQVQTNDHDTPVDPASFGINKVSAVEYLTPAGDDTTESPVEPGLSLELVSLEESVAPTMIETPVHEMSLDVTAGLRRLLVIGATAGSTESVCDFFRALSARPDMAMLLVQHQRDTSVEALRVRLAEVTDIPVRVAEQGGIVRRGELTLICAGQQPHVDRGGRLRLDVAGERACDPSIDAAFSAVASQFGGDATAMLLVDDANDAVAGAQAIHDRGGRVWLHQRNPDESSSMVSMLREEGLVDAEDVPAAFAAQLLDETGAL